VATITAAPVGYEVFGLASPLSFQMWALPLRVVVALQLVLSTPVKENLGVTLRRMRYLALADWDAKPGAAAGPAPVSAG
jgi:hypothetical protein